MNAPTRSTDFDRAYRAPLTPWGDVRMPSQILELARLGTPETCLELGCGLGRFTRRLARQGLRATGVDFSAVAIERAREAAAGDELRAEYLVGDVTSLDALRGPFDFSFDVGCFHCLDASGQRRYVAEVHRLLKPGGTHLVWALDASPSDIPLSPEAMAEIFAPRFVLDDSEPSRRRLVASHWYWLVRDAR